MKRLWGPEGRRFDRFFRIEILKIRKPVCILFFLAVLTVYTTAVSLFISKEAVSGDELELPDRSAEAEIQRAYSEDASLPESVRKAHAFLAGYYEDLDRLKIYPGSWQEIVLSTAAKYVATELRDNGLSDTSGYEAALDTVINGDWQEWLAQKAADEPKYRYCLENGIEPSPIDRRYRILESVNTWDAAGAEIAYYAIENAPENFNFRNSETIALIIAFAATGLFPLFPLIEYLSLEKREGTTGLFNRIRINRCGRFSAKAAMALIMYTALSLLAFTVSTVVLTAVFALNYGSGPCAIFVFISAGKRIVCMSAMLFALFAFAVAFLPGLALLVLFALRKSGRNSS